VGQQIVLGRRAVLEDEGGGAIVGAGLQRPGVQQGAGLNAPGGVGGVHLLDEGAVAKLLGVDVLADGLVGGEDGRHFGIVLPPGVVGWGVLGEGRGGEGEDDGRHGGGQGRAGQAHGNLR